MVLSLEQKLAKNARRVEQRASARAAKKAQPRAGVREELVSSLVCSVIKKVIQKAKARGRTSAWNSNNPERRKKRDLNYHQANKKAASDAGLSYAEWMGKKKEENSKKEPYDANRRIKERKKTDFEFLIVSRMRTRLGEFMKLTNGTKAAGTMELVGCSQTQLVQHLQSQLPEGESLDDKSTDHIFAMTLYDMTCPDEQRRCMNYTNLQPMKLSGVGGNTSKGNSLPSLQLAQRVSRDCWPAAISEDDLN